MICKYTRPHGEACYGWIRKDIRVIEVMSHCTYTFYINSSGEIIHIGACNTTTLVCLKFYSNQLARDIKYLTKENNIVVFYVVFKSV